MRENVSRFLHELVVVSASLENPAFQTTGAVADVAEGNVLKRRLGDFDGKVDVEFEEPAAKRRTAQDCLSFQSDKVCGKGENIRSRTVRAVHFENSRRVAFARSTTSRALSYSFREAIIVSVHMTGSSNFS